MAVKNVASGSQGVVPRTGGAANDRSAELKDVSEAQSAQRSQNAQAGYSKASAARNTAAEVNISPKAREMALANRVVKETPDVREEKIAQLRKMVQDGEYKVDAGRIADGMLREAMKDEISRRPEVALED